ncbi:hypothetical protein CUT44_11030 [Streptomyces carminius]|uniref:DUF5666 domain-containing protein n=1 Tax=Streptomyces carminius TaxID=2665496 RepID=A0A2M8M0F0_9ACTN|nr:hypothetical protein [Streptomyces carminius]PJE97666.1 hypothetical protein CUT44_11030 [Streptomyces carminius]
MRRHLRLIAVVTVVVLALSGFSQARSSGGKGGGSRSGGGGGGGGGGCGKDSSSSSSSSRYRGGDSDNDGGSSSSGGSGSSSSSSRKPDARIVSCLGKDGKTVVELKSRGRTETFVVYVDFRDETGSLVGSARAQTRLKAGQTKRVEMRPEDSAAADRAKECDLRSVF